MEQVPTASRGGKRARDAAALLLGFSPDERAVLDAACERHDVTPLAVLAGRDGPDVVEARRDAIADLYERFGLKLWQIGERMGIHATSVRDHLIAAGVEMRRTWTITRRAA